jgi:hypothetical protein
VRFMITPNYLSIEKRAITIVTEIPVKYFYTVDNLLPSL